MQRAVLQPLGHGGDSYEVVRLSRRERETLRLLCQGLPTKAIAGRMGLTPETVNTSIKNLCKGLRVSNRPALMVWAFQNPQVWIPTTHVPTRLHPEGCVCASLWCTAMRLADASLKFALEPTGT